MDQVDPALDLTTRPTGKREMLARLGRVFLSAGWLKLVRPHSPEGETGLRPTSLNTMLRIQLMRQWFTLRYPAVEAALHDTPPLRGFGGVGWGSRMADETMIVRFRHSPEKQRLTKQILAGADTTLTLASTPTKNVGSEHADPRTTKKGKEWYLGMNAHIGGDAGYQVARKRRVAETDVTWHVATRRVERKVLDETKIVDRHRDQIERREASVHDKVEHPFLPIKGQVSDMCRRDITDRRGYRAGDHAARYRPFRSCAQSCSHVLVSSGRERRMWPGKAEKGCAGHMIDRFMMAVSHGNLVNSWISRRHVCCT